MRTLTLIPTSLCTFCHSASRTLMLTVFNAWVCRFHIYTVTPSGSGRENRLKLCHCRRQRCSCIYTLFHCKYPNCKIRSNYSIRYIAFKSAAAASATTAAVNVDECRWCANVIFTISHSLKLDAILRQFSIKYSSNIFIRITFLMCIQKRRVYTGV